MFVSKRDHPVYSETKGDKKQSKLESKSITPPHSERLKLLVLELDFFATSFFLSV